MIANDPTDQTNAAFVTNNFANGAQKNTANLAGNVNWFGAQINQAVVAGNSAAGSQANTATIASSSSLGT